MAIISIMMCLQSVKVLSVMKYDLIFNCSNRGQMVITPEIRFHWKKVGTRIKEIRKTKCKTL